METDTPTTLKAYDASRTKDGKKIMNRFAISLSVNKLGVGAPKAFRFNVSDVIHFKESLVRGMFTHIPIILGEIIFGRSVILTNWERN